MTLHYWIRCMLFRLVSEPPKYGPRMGHLQFFLPRGSSFLVDAFKVPCGDPLLSNAYNWLALIPLLGSKSGHVTYHPKHNNWFWERQTWLKLEQWVSILRLLPKYWRKRNSFRVDTARGNNEKRLELPVVNKYYMIIKSKEGKEVVFRDKVGVPGSSFDWSQSIPWPFQLSGSVHVFLSLFSFVLQWPSV